MTYRTKVVPPGMASVEVAERLKILLKVFEVRQGDLAAICHTIPATMSKYCNGRAALPTYTAGHVVLYFRVPLDWLLLGHTDCLTKPLRQRLTKWPET